MTDKRKSHLNLSFCEAHLVQGILNFLLITFSWDFKHGSFKFWMPNAMNGVIFVTNNILQCENI